MRVAEYQPAEFDGPLFVAHLHGFYRGDDGLLRRPSANGQVEARVAMDGAGWFFMTATPGDPDPLSTDRRRCGTIDGALRNARYWLAVYNAGHRP